MSDFLKTKNIVLPKELTSTYGDVDGLSLQNLFYTRNRVFPGCFMFDNESRTNGDYTFDTDKMMKYFIENIPEDENMELTPYFTKILGSENDKTETGFCLILNKSNIYARFEKRVSESYVLFKNENFEELKKFIETVLQFYISPEGEGNTFFRICASSSGFYLEKGRTKCPENFDVKKLYDDSFLKEDEKIKEFIASDSNSGLIILHGERGTGKSSYIKHLINIYPNKKFVYVPAALINLLGDPAFGSFLISLNNHIIILEDCENVIKDRKQSGSAAAVSLLLNLSDGILSDDLEMKFICTFNDDMKNIDDALLRKGRLISKYEFKPLCIEKAEALLKERGIEATLTKPISLADIFHYGEDGYETIKKSII